MKIGIDMMGGDFAPLEAVKGVIEAHAELPDAQLVLFGPEQEITDLLVSHGANPADFHIVNCTQVIQMAEHPTKAIQQKPDSTIFKGFEYLKAGKIDGFASAGNTGAMLVGAMFTVKAIEGVIRPSLTTLVPMEDGSTGILLDVGANADCKPEVLFQFGLLGSLLAEHVYNIKSPKVALLNIGEEEEKGNIATKEAHQLLKKAEKLNFVGNVEGRDIFSGAADVMVCDGFTGNIVLKMAESFYTLVKKRKISNEYFDRFNYENYGGTPILGVNSTVVIGHGISKSLAIKNMIILTKDVAQAGLSEKIKLALQSITVAPSNN